MWTRFLFLLAVFQAVLLPRYAAQDSPDVALPTFTSADGDFATSWRLLNENEIELSISAFTSTVDGVYVGIGFSIDGGAMGPADYYTGQMDGLSGGAVYDRWLGSGNHYPPEDAVSNILSFDCMVEPEVYSCNFTRFINTGDTEQDISLNQTLTLFWAYGPLHPDGDLDYHASNRGKSGTVNVLEAANPAPPPSFSARALMVQAHGIAMLAAWMVLLPVGSFVARFRQQLGFDQKGPNGRPPMWWRMHQPMQYTGVVLTVIGTIIIFVRAGAMTPEYLFSSITGGSHQLTGIIAVALMLSQPVFAVLRNGLPNADGETRKRAHFIWHWIHAVTGYCSLCLGLIAIGLGMVEFSTTWTYPLLFAVGFAIGVGSLFFFFGVGIIVQAKAPSPKKVDSGNRGVALSNYTPSGGAKAATFVSHSVDHATEGESAENSVENGAASTQHQISELAAFTSQTTPLGAFCGAVAAPILLVLVTLGAVLCSWHIAITSIL